MKTKQQIKTTVFAILCPGERFTKLDTPNIVYIKTSHTWAHAFWKGIRSDIPLHYSTPIVRATSEQKNPGE